MDRSELLEAKIINAHEKLWDAILRVKQLPPPYSGALDYFKLYTPQELEKAREKPELQFSMTTLEFTKLIDSSDLDPYRLYIDDHLWNMATSRIAFSDRLLVLFSSDGPNDGPNPVGLTNWPEDKLIVQHLLTAFSQRELDQFNYSPPGVFGKIVEKWESRILTEIKKALSAHQTTTDGP